MTSSALGKQKPKQNIILLNSTFFNPVQEKMFGINLATYKEVKHYPSLLESWSFKLACAVSISRCDQWCLFQQLCSPGFPIWWAPNQVVEWQWSWSHYALRPGLPLKRRALRVPLGQHGSQWTFRVEMPLLFLGTGKNCALWYAAWLFTFKRLKWHFCSQYCILNNYPAKSRGISSDT